MLIVVATRLQVQLMLPMKKRPMNSVILKELQSEILHLIEAWLIFHSSVTWKLHDRYMAPDKYFIVIVSLWSDGWWDLLIERIYFHGLSIMTRTRIMTGSWPQLSKCMDWTSYGFIHGLFYLWYEVTNWYDTVESAQAINIKLKRQPWYLRRLTYLKIEMSKQLTWQI